MYISAINGAAMSTDRATSFSGFRHSSEKMAELSKPDSAPIAILARTLMVVIEKLGHARDKELRESGVAITQALTKRYSSNRNVPTVSTELAPLSHLPTCNPRTLKTK